MSIKRYMNDLDDMVEHRNGDFVTYEDHAAEVATEVARLNDQVRALAAEASIQDFIISAVRDLARESDGVTGWHRNGDVASWDEALPELAYSITPATDAILNEVRAQGAEEAIDKAIDAMVRSGAQTFGDCVVAVKSIRAGEVHP